MNQFICTACRQTYPLQDPRWRCDCGSLLDIVFQPRFNLDKITARPSTMWRYREAIPIEQEANIISLDEGFTPLTQVSFAGRPVWLKQDHLFPTGSYKDRGAAVLISKVKELGIQAVVEDSSGNAGCAIAAYCALADIACDIFVPAEISAGKLAQIQFYGATLNKIVGTRADTAQAVLTAAEQIYYASHFWNPFFFQGTKTFAYEVCEQLNWQAPDVVVLPVGNGTLLLGVDIGFRELEQAGLVNQGPKLIAIQAENCAPLVQTAPDNKKISPSSQSTLAEGIAIADPIRGQQIMNVVQASGGHFLTVSEVEIKTSLHDMSRKGFYIEPTSAATTAGVAKYLSQVAEDEVIVSVLTGHGLKATEKMLKLIFSD